MPAACGTARASTCAWACGCSLKVGGRVETGCQGLFQARVGLDFIIVSLRLVGGGLPVAVLRNVDQLAISQLQGHFATEASHDLFAHEQALAFEYLALEAVKGNGKNLAYKAFYDGDDSAHRTGSGMGAVKR